MGWFQPSADGNAVVDDHRANWDFTGIRARCASVRA